MERLMHKVQGEGKTSIHLQSVFYGKAGDLFPFCSRCTVKHFFNVADDKGRKADRTCL